MTLNHIPVPTGIRIDGRRFKHEGRATIQQWPIDHIGVSSNPSTICHASKQVTILQAKGIVGGKGGIQGVPTRRVQEALGFSSAARRVQNKQVIFRIHPLRGAVGTLLRHQHVHANILGVFDKTGLFDGPVADRSGVKKSFPNKNGFQNGFHVQFGACRVANIFEGNGFATAFANVGRDQEFGSGGGHALGQGFSAKTRKDDGMDSANTGAGQHGHGQFGDHGHVNGHNITLLHTLAFERIGDLTRGLQHLRVGEFSNIIGLVSFRDNGNLIGMPTDHAIEAVEGYV
mmetsp:Transcript_3470/g.9597  ORF Transcript_3470/g.9597 Transcript_3470/m.9597 type:complete len:287 (-) Transcript_3470:365-1225(-)